MKETALAGTIGVIGGTVSTLFGGWNTSMTTLVIFMCIDYVTGLMVAGVFKKSKKTETGALESGIGFKGLCRKVAIMLAILVACRLDIVIGSTFVRDATCIGFITNETISLLENFSLMGVKLPKQLTKAIDILKAKEDEYEDTSEE